MCLFRGQLGFSFNVTHKSQVMFICFQCFFFAVIQGVGKMSYNCLTCGSMVEWPRCMYSVKRTHTLYFFYKYKTFELYLPEQFYSKGKRGVKVGERNGYMMDK